MVEWIKPKRLQRASPTRGLHNTSSKKLKYPTSERINAAAEAHLRRAMELAPTEPGRVLDLARYIAKRGRPERERFVVPGVQARKMFPGQPRVGFAEARVDIENNRSMEKARALLEEYLHARLTPDDPPRQEAEMLLRRVGGSTQ